MVKIAVIIILQIFCTNAIEEPYPSLNGGIMQNNSYTSEYSPDPLVNYVWNLSNINASALQIYNVTAKYAYTDHEGSFNNLESIYMTPNNVNVIIFGPGNITIDFGQENAAWFEIDSNDCDDIGLTMSISEYNEPGYTGNNAKYPKTLKPIKYTQNGITTYRLETNAQLYDGVRYGFIHVSSQTNKPWHITAVRAVSQIKPENYIGSFQSNEYPMLNKIWYSAAYCVKMNMLPNGFGAILMDRGDRIAWVGDNHISQRVATYAFGAFDYVKQSIINTGGQSNNILSYALYWVESVYDFYMQTNDTSLLKTVETLIIKALNQSIALFGTNPHLSFYGWDDRIGAGFEGAQTSKDAQYAYQMLTIQTIGKSLIFFNKNGLNNMGLFNYYSSKRTEFIDAIRAENGYLNKFGLHSSADGINGEWLNISETNYLFSKWYNDSINICSFSPFNMFFIAESMGNVKQIDYLLSALDLCWGNSVRLGATTFWEVFSPEWMNMGLEKNDPIPNSVNGWTSECHPWSSGALSIITAYITGIKIIKPGYKYIEIQPQLFQIKSDIPLINNKVIRIDFDAYNNKYMIDIPIEMKIDIYLPVSIDNIDSEIYYMHNMQTYNIQSAKVVTKREISYRKVHFEAIKPGMYLFKQRNAIIKQGKINEEIPNVFPAPNYACAVVSQDYETKGQWIGAYGKNGYMLYGFNSGAKNVQKLPVYVNNITKVDGSQLTQWIESTTDMRALQDPTDNNVRRLGTIFNSPTYAISVNIDASKISNNGTYLMSLYLCDWDYNNRKQTIHVLDANTLNIVAPIIFNEDYVNGKWITYQLDRSVRIRMNFVRGTNAVLSGIFFD